MVKPRKTTLGITALFALIACSEHAGERSLITSPDFTRPTADVVASSVTITTDKSDYAPGEIVTITGTGWAANETVHLVLSEDQPIHEPRTWDVQANADGTFTDTSFSPEEHDIGVTFHLTATGQDSGRTAETTFTDGTITGVSLLFYKGTTSGSPPDACTGIRLDEPVSVASGTEVCVVASLSISGLTTSTPVQLRWENPSEVVVEVSGANLPSGLTSGALSASYVPSTAGTWNVLVCESTVEGGTSGCPTSASFRGSIEFNVTAPTSDVTAPTVNCTVPSQLVWYNNNVTVNCTASDAGSGLADPADGSFSLFTDVADGSETATALTGSRTVSDKSGNSKVVGPYDFMVDLKAPVIVCGSATAIWYATDQSVTCMASDGGSGLKNSADGSFELATDVPAGTETNNASTGKREVADAAGNSATAGAVSGFHIDKKGPSVACTTPAQSFLLNQSPADVTGTATDGGSGPSSQNVSAPAHTSSLGRKSVELTAQDNVGNVGGKMCAYSVGYIFDGLFAPVDKPNTLNVSRAGQTIPLKWKLTDGDGNPVTTLTSVRLVVNPSPCMAGSPTDDLEEYTAGSSGLQNLGGGYYQFNWKTPVDYAGSCMSLSLNLGEGTERGPVALFRFKN
jgi:hypothetical protein